MSVSPAQRQGEETRGNKENEEKKERTEISLKDRIPGRVGKRDMPLGLLGRRKNKRKQEEEEEYEEEYEGQLAPRIPRRDKASARRRNERRRGGGGGGWIKTRTRNGNGRSNEAKRSFVCGAAASVFSKILLQPLDTLKTIVQVAKTRTQVQQTSSPFRINFVREGAHLVSKSGIRSLFRGLPASLIVSAPSSAVFFSVYDPVKEYAKAHCFPNDPFVPCLFAAAVGNVFSSIVRVPPENVKLQVQAGLKDNGIQALRSILRQKDGGLGLAGLYRGYWAQLLKDIPYSGVQFVTYDYVKHKLGLNGLASGALAGACAVLVTSPLDVIKTRIMTAVHPQQCLHLGILQMGVMICGKEGPSALFKGLVPRLLHKVPASAVCLMTYDFLQAALPQVD